MKVFLTGATGFLGSHVARLLAEGGHDVVALVRDVTRGASCLPARAICLEGDLTRPGSYAEHLAGVDAVIHAAACYGEFYRSACDASQLRRVNVVATQRLLQAAREHAVSRMVYVSSAGVLDTVRGAPTDESATYADPADGPYFESKIAAEKLVLEFAKMHTDMQIVSLLPVVMIGPGDRGPSPTGATLQRVLTKEIDIKLPGSMNVVDVRDVAEAVVAFLDHGEPGARYLIGGQRHSIRELFETLGTVSGTAVGTKSPPPAVLKLALRVRGRRPPLRAQDIDRLMRPFWFSSAAARRDLGVTYRPFEQTLTDAAHWFLHDPTKSPHPPRHSGAPSSL